MDISEEGIKPDDKTYVTIFNTSIPSSDRGPNLKIQLNHPFKTWGVLADAKHPKGVLVGNAMPRGAE